MSFRVLASFVIVTLQGVPLVIRGIFGESPLVVKSQVVDFLYNLLSLVKHPVYDFRLKHSFD